MRTFLSPDAFVMTCVVVVLFFFLFRAAVSRLAASGKPKETAFNDFLFASKELGIRDIRESMAATYCAFATVFFWFIALGNTYSWLLFLIPVFLYLGNELFIWVVQKGGIELGQYSTIGTYVRSKTSYKLLHYVFDWIIVVFLFSTLLVEIVIGSGILASMMPNAPGDQLFFVILLSVLVIGYVIVGGFRAVILSDAVQLYLTIAAITALLVFSIFYLPNPQSAGTYLYTPDVNVYALFAFVISVVVVQFLGPLCQLQNWQRIASSAEQKTALRGHRQGAILGASVWAVMIICALILYVKLEGTVSFDAIFSQMKTTGVFPAYALYPLLFVGFVAAMISTADSAIAAFYLFLYDGLRRRKESRPGEKFIPTIKHHILTGALLFVSILIIYLITQTRIQSFVISIIYFLFNQLLVLFPVLLFLVVEAQLKRKISSGNTPGSIHHKFERNQTLALVIGWITVLVMTGIGYFSDSLNWIMYASGGGVLMVTLVMIPSIAKLYELRSQNQSQV